MWETGGRRFLTLWHWHCGPSEGRYSPKFLLVTEVDTVGPAYHTLTWGLHSQPAAQRKGGGKIVRDSYVLTSSPSILFLVLVLPLVWNGSPIRALWGIVLEVGSETETSKKVVDGIFILLVLFNSRSHPVLWYREEVRERIDNHGKQWTKASQTGQWWYELKKDGSHKM